MKRYATLALLALAVTAGCVSVDTNSGSTSKTREIEFIVSRPILQQYGITLPAVERHFQSLGYPQGSYERVYKDQTLIITLVASPEKATRIAESALKSSNGAEVLVQDICTIHYKRK